MGVNGAGKSTLLKPSLVGGAAGCRGSCVGRRGSVKMGRFCAATRWTLLKGEKDGVPDTRCWSVPRAARVAASLAGCFGFPATTGG